MKLGLPSADIGELAQRAGSVVTEYLRMFVAVCQSWISASLDSRLVYIAIGAVDSDDIAAVVVAWLSSKISRAAEANPISMAAAWSFIALATAMNLAISVVIVLSAIVYIVSKWRQL